MGIVGGEEGKGKGIIVVVGTICWYVCMSLDIVVLCLFLVHIQYSYFSFRVPLPKRSFQSPILSYTTSKIVPFVTPS